MDNYLIRYDNCVNAVFPTGLTKLEMNAFMYLLSLFDRDSSDEVTISYKRFREIIGYNPKRTTKNFDDVLKILGEKLVGITLYTENIDSSADYCIFPTFIRNWFEGSLTVGINPRARKYLDISKGYTQFDIREYISLKSKAAKYIFIHLKQFRSTGMWHISLEEFKKRLGACSYSNNNCIQKLIHPAIRELSDKNIFSNLSFKTEYAKTHGNPAKSLMFTFTPENIERKPINSQKTDMDPLYLTAEAMLKGFLPESDIQAISKAAKNCKITPVVLKRCINIAIYRDNVENPTGYIISLIRKASDAQLTYTPKAFPQVSTRNPYAHAFHNFNERTYDYAALEMEVLGG